MNTSFSKTRVAYVAVLVIVCLVLIAGGCGPTVPTEEYDLEKTKAELATARADLEKTEAELTTANGNLEKTKAELATARADLEKTEKQIAEASLAWSSLKPKVELLLILIENIETNSGIALYTFGHGQVTVREAMIQVEDQWERIAVALEAIGNADLTESLEYGWTTGLHGSWSSDTQVIKHHLEWNRATRLLIDLTEPDMENLSEQVSQ